MEEPSDRWTRDEMDKPSDWWTRVKAIAYEPEFYMVYADNLSARGQRTLGLGQYVENQLINNRLFLDIYLLNQKSIDPNFTSIQGSFFETVGGYPDAHSHCYSGNSQFTCCRVFNSSGYRCQSIGSPFALIQLDPKQRLNPTHQTTIYTYVHAREKVEASNSMQVIRSDAVLGDEVFDHEHAVFYLCEDHFEMFSYYFNNAELKYQVDGLAPPSLANLLAEQISSQLYNAAVEALAAFLQTLNVASASFFDNKAFLASVLDKIPTEKMLKLLPISYDLVIRPLNRLWKSLPTTVTSNQKFIQFYNMINSIRVVDAINVARPVQLPIGWQQGTDLRTFREIKVILQKTLEENEEWIRIKGDVKRNAFDYPEVESITNDSIQLSPPVSPIASPQTSPVKPRRVSTFRAIRGYPKRVPIANQPTPQAPRRIQIPASQEEKQEMRVVKRVGSYGVSPGRPQYISPGNTALRMQMVETPRLSPSLLATPRRNGSVSPISLDDLLGQDLARKLEPIAERQSASASSTYEDQYADSEDEWEKDREPIRTPVKIRQPLPLESRSEFSSLESSRSVSPVRIRPSGMSPQLSRGISPQPSRPSSVLSSWEPAPDVQEQQRMALAERIIRLLEEQKQRQARLTAQ